jgi:hypothetical protein
MIAYSLSNNIVQDKEERGRKQTFRISVPVLITSVRGNGIRVIGGADLCQIISTDVRGWRPGGREARQRWQLSTHPELGRHVLCQWLCSEPPARVGKATAGPASEHGVSLCTGQLCGLSAS